MIHQLLSVLMSFNSLGKSMYLLSIYVVHSCALVLYKHIILFHKNKSSLWFRFKCGSLCGIAINTRKYLHCHITTSTAVQATALRAAAGLLGLLVLQETIGNRAIQSGIREGGPLFGRFVRFGFATRATSSFLVGSSSLVLHQAMLMVVDILQVGGSRRVMMGMVVMGWPDEGWWGVGHHAGWRQVWWVEHLGRWGSVMVHRHDLGIKRMCIFLRSFYLLKEHTNQVTRSAYIWPPLNTLLNQFQILINSVFTLKPPLNLTPPQKNKSGAT